MKRPQFLVALSVKILTKALREDERFYYSYQSNIAMAFFDELRRQANKPEITAEFNRANINCHELCNAAAKNFLNLWLKP